MGGNGERVQLSKRTKKKKKKEKKCKMKKKMEMLAGKRKVKNETKV
jgi:hypothetical protein